MSGTENFNDYPKHPGQTTPRPYYVEIPLETFETMSKELAELRKHELAWDLDKARIKELEAENEILKYSVATLDTDLAMMKRWRKVNEELPPSEGSYLCAYKNKNKEDGNNFCSRDPDLGMDSGCNNQLYRSFGP